jgi:hypothetical protein
MSVRLDGATAREEEVSGIDAVSGEKVTRVRSVGRIPHPEGVIGGSGRVVDLTGDVFRRR